jgi:excinuclease ABC subunit B
LINYGRLGPGELAKKLAGLERQMHEHARNLEFEAAARLRDEIRHIRNENLGLVD